ncbi:MAG: hypothetical protein C3F07_21520 [Anaerolineales bacterium]|nr:hypothetical protein [Anaerolineae bacterium]PWB68769.1 MAG: hypothetical protein C3F07_21520 [Anaerolineales bacterium]
MSKPNEEHVLNLLKSLKQAENNYPSELLQTRRDLFAKQVASAAILTHSAGNGGGSSAAGAGQGSAGTAASSTAIGSSIGTILEVALVVAIVAEAGVAAYIYREKIADFFNSFLSPNSEVVTNPSDDLSLPVTGDVNITDTPVTETPIVTVTVSPYDTPVAPSQVIDASGSGAGTVQAPSTPNPTDDNPGLHLGQTKQPTKAPKNDSNDGGDNGGDNGSNGNNNKDKDKK